jgi:hypothetical protein
MRTASIIMVLMEAVLAERSVYLNETTCAISQKSCHLHACRLENLKYYT